MLEITQPSISDAKRRKVIPSDWLMKLLEKRRINPEWIRTGQGERSLQAGRGVGRIYRNGAAIGRRPADECSTDELLAEILRRTLKHMR